MRRRAPAGLGLAALLAAPLVLAACAAPGEAAREPLVVFAASSLTDAFEDIGEAFGTEHPEAGPVTFAFAGSQQLARQLLEGAGAGVFAAADARQMALVSRAGLVDGEPQPFARNRLAIAVEAGNPLDIGGLADLAGVTVVLPAEPVPAGAYARRALDAAGVTLAPASLEASARSALAKVELGEADATIVFASDVATTARAGAVALPAEHDVEATYPVAVLAGAPDREAARAFVAFVRGPAGQEVLERHGFLPR